MSMCAFLVALPLRASHSDGKVLAARHVWSTKGDSSAYSDRPALIETGTKALSSLNYHFVTWLTGTFYESFVLLALQQ